MGTGPEAGVGTGSSAEAAAVGDIVVLAVLGRAAEEALTLAGAANLAGKTLIDVTNPISDEPPRKGAILLTIVAGNYMLGPSTREDLP